MITTLKIYFIVFFLAVLILGPSGIMADPLDPNAYPSLGPLPEGSFTINTDDLTLDGVPVGVLVSPGGTAPDVAVFTFDGGSMLAGGETITVTGSRPLVLLFQGNAIISGVIDVSGHNGEDGQLLNGWITTAYGGAGGPGAGSGGNSGIWGDWDGKSGEGPGGGGGGGSAASATGVGGGGGGGFGGYGGVGGGTYGSGAGEGGSSYGDMLAQLEGGSGGGGGGFRSFQGNAGGGGGGGGGAIEIGAMTALYFIGGVIVGNGGDGGENVSAAGDGGGGSGGGIFLHAYDIGLDEYAALGAKGGRGGYGFNRTGGCGGGGHIVLLINTGGQFINQTVPGAIDVSAGYNCENPATHPEKQGVFMIVSDPNVGSGGEPEPECGDGNLDAGEACDDGNTVDGDGCSSICQLENQPPVAQCQDQELSTDPGACSVGTVSVDAGSYDPDGDQITLSQSFDGPFPPGSSAINLTVTDEYGETDSCVAMIEVTDDEQPVAQCNAPATIVPPDAPISFVVTADDNCQNTSVEITEYDCYFYNGSGKRVDKTKSCVVAIEGDMISILDSGGVGDHITWTVQAVDSSGNTAETTCELEVVNPGKGKAK